MKSPSKSAPRQTAEKYRHYENRRGKQATSFKQAKEFVLRDLFIAPQPLAKSIGDLASDARLLGVP